jgi:hypothetical protein
MNFNSRFHKFFQRLPIMRPPALVFVRVVVGRDANLGEVQFGGMAGFFGKCKGDYRIMAVWPALRSPCLDDALARFQFQSDAVDVIAVAGERRAGFGAYLRRFAGELRMLFSIHQRVVDFFRRRVNEHFMVDVFCFHGCML